MARADRSLGPGLLASAWGIGLLELVAGLALCIWLLAWPPVFRFYYPLTGASNHTEDAAAIVDWLWGSEPAEVLNGTLRSGKLRPKELSHYSDVRRLLRCIPMVLVPAAFLLGVGIVCLDRRREVLRAAQWRGVWIVAIVLAGAAALAWWDWKVFFAWVHYPFFGPTSWKLGRSSYSLQLFPAEFWQMTGVAVVSSPVAGMAVILAVLRVNYRRFLR